MMLRRIWKYKGFHYNRLNTGRGIKIWNRRNILRAWRRQIWRIRKRNIRRKRKMSRRLTCPAVPEHVHH